ncbi:acyltransferase family protein [Bradyrhizobium sp. RDI18]|uniref:acyltransferase family protein n=1 Tax=Bradyrhizobium sp. RDI18 TaxID=3367400 RepID=UPI0037234B5F
MYYSIADAQQPLRADTRSTATRKHPGGGTFRLDINALRALSVLAVLGYHLKIPGFAGGFVGVDVFLVITGYLMTGKVLAELAAGRFSLWSFGMLRMRRIYPALAVVVISSAIIGWFVTLPGEYLRHLRQACYALVALSNFAFDADNGYFAMAAQTKPLLHTWSLALEWQFYIWMPLVAALIWRRALPSKSRSSVMMGAFLSVGFVSLAWCLWQSHSDMMGSAFFSLRARAWEPLAGGLIAVSEFQRRTESTAGIPFLTAPAAAIGGWVLIAACIVFPLPETQWPGPLTLLPILGAALIVAARQQADGGGLLGLPLIQRVGDWSYSIYLWHWPIWVFALSWLSFRGYDVNAREKMLMLAASILLGAASYYLVEQPVRKRRDFWTERRLVSSASIAFCLLIAFTATAFLNNGFPMRLPEYLLAAEEARRNGTPRDECFRNSNSAKQVAETYCRFGSEGVAGRPTAILWGDSFANQYLVPISSAALRNGVHGLIATQSACRAFIDDPALNSGDQQPCREFNRSTMDFVLGHAEPSIVVIGSNWGSAIEISALVDRLLSSGKTVILIMPLLNVGFDVPQRWMENQTRAGRALDEWKVEADPVLTMSSLRAEISKILDKYKDDPRLIAADPLPLVCEHSHCYLVRNGQSNFRDTAHISNVNAMQYTGLFDAAFRLAVQATSKAAKEADLGAGIGRAPVPPATSLN